MKNSPARRARTSPPRWPAMAENRITEYNKESNTVSWFYNDHKDEKRYDVTDNVIDFINRLIIHIPDYHFLIIRCQCF